MVRFAIVILIFAIVSLTTLFGWRPSQKAFKRTLPERDPLALRLQAHVYRLSHEIGDRSVFRYGELNEAADYIEDQFRSYGYEPKHHLYSVHGKSVKNIVASKTGTTHPDEIFIVGAHYDTCSNPGADDNASGVAGLLELARLSADQPTRSTVRFVAFVNEEPPFYKTPLMGSRVYTRDVKKRKENIQGALILEMIGYYTDAPHSQRYPPLLGPFYPSRGNFIGIVGNFSSAPLNNEVVRSFKKHSAFPIESISTFGFVPGVDFSDHGSFWKEGYPAVMITDTAFYRSNTYHNDSDTYEKLDYDRAAEVVRGFDAVLRELANA